MKTKAFGAIAAPGANFFQKILSPILTESGGTGSGKTTMLNALSDYIPEEERVVTIEDSAELQISNIPNLVRLEIRNANTEGNHAVTIRDLIKTSLRMRPSRIIVGEVRDAASIDMLQSLNTGHTGMSTGHANSPADMISRIETMTLLGEDIPLLAVRKQITSAIDIIIHLGRLRDKTRRVLEITEVVDCDHGEVVLHPLFQFREISETADGYIQGTLFKTSYSLKRRSKLVAAGLSLDGWEAGEMTGVENRVRNGMSNDVRDREPNGVQDREPNGVRDREPNGVRNREPNGVQNREPNVARNREPNGDKTERSYTKCPDTVGIQEVAVL